MTQPLEEKNIKQIKPPDITDIPHAILNKFNLPRITLIKHHLWRQGLIVIGSLVAALGFTVFQVPFNLAAGGLTGISLIINSFIKLPVGMTVLLMNIPLLCLGFFMLGRWRFLISTLLAAFCFSSAIDFFNTYLPQVARQWPITDERLLAAVYAGLLFGIGLGIIQRAGGSIGGTNIPARILYQRYGFPLSQSYLYTDGIVILLAGIVFEWEVALLAILTLVLNGIVSDLVVEGVSQVRTATIVSKNPDDVRWAIIHRLHRGVSLWSIEGGYSKSEHTMILCTIRRSQVADLKHTISTVDPEAFIIIGIAQQVVGGYDQYIPLPDLRNDADEKPQQPLAE